MGSDPLITCFAYIVLFCFSLPSIKKRINGVFCLYLAVAAIWSFTAFMLHLNAFPMQALFWNEATTVALVWTLVTYYHFIKVYAGKTGVIDLVAGYSGLFIVAVFCFMGFIVKYAYVERGILYNSLGNSIYVIGVASLTANRGRFYLLIKKYRGSTDPADRNKTMYLLFGWSIYCCLVIQSYPCGDRTPLDHIGSLVNVFIIAYAVSKYQLLDIRFVVRRGLGFTLAIIPLPFCISRDHLLCLDIIPACRSTLFC